MNARQIRRPLPPHPECVWPARALLGEGPVWLPEEKALYWVDIKGELIHRFHPGSGRQDTWSTPAPIGTLVPRRAGGFIAALKTGFHRVNLLLADFEPVCDPEAHLPDNRFNDGKADVAGRIWAGSMDDKETEPSGVLYRLDPDGTCTAMDRGYVVTNGPAFSPDGKTLYHTDTFARTIHAFDLGDDGELANKRPFIHIADDAGYPDGMTVDAEGCLWVAQWGGWRVARFSPQGDPLGDIPMPVAQVTSCAFGGPRMKTLFITTAAVGLDRFARAEQPFAGGLFAVEVDAVGLPPCRYAG